MMAWWRERAWELAASLALAAIYISVLWLLPHGVFWHPDEGGKFIQMQSVEWNGGLRTTVRYGAERNDPEFRFYPTRCGGNRVYPEIVDGKAQFQWPVWFPLAVRPFYQRWGAAGLYVIPLLGAWLTAILSGTWVRPHSKALAAATILLVGIATPVTYYGYSFLEHTTATFFGMLGLWALCRERHRPIALVCGFLMLAAAVALRIEMAVLVGAAVVGWLVATARAPTLAGPRSRRWWTRPEMWLLASGVIVAMLAALWFVTPRHWDALRQIPHLLRDNRYRSRFLLDSLRYILINARGYGATPVTPGAELMALVGLATCLIAPLLGRRRAIDVVMLIAYALLIELSVAITLLSEAYVARQGLFTVAPFLAIAMYALPYAWQRRERALLCLAGTATTYLVGAIAVLFTTRIGYSGDYLVGLEGPARYVLILYPLWVPLGTVAALVHYRSTRPALVRSGLVLLTVMAIGTALTYQVRGIVSLQKNRQVFANWMQAMPSTTPLLTSEWWLGAAIAPYFISHEMYCVPSVARLGDWVVFAQAHGMTQFTFAVRRGVEPLPDITAGLPLTVESDRLVDGLQLMTLRVTGAP